MVHRIQSVKAKKNYMIEAVFYSGEIIEYNVKRLFLVFPQFKIFEKEKELFEKVVVDDGGYGISWNDELDLNAETIWEDGIFIEMQKEADANHLLAHRLLMSRETANMTQKELAEKTGIYQADISKLERGIGNPSLHTLKRLADGLGMELKVDFIVKKRK